MAKQNEIRLQGIPDEISIEARNVSNYYGVAFSKLIMPTVVRAIKDFPKEAREFDVKKLHE